MHQSSSPSPSPSSLVPPPRPCWPPTLLAGKAEKQNSTIFSYFPKRTDEEPPVVVLWTNTHTLSLPLSVPFGIRGSYFEHTHSLALSFSPRARSRLGHSVHCPYRGPLSVIILPLIYVIPLSFPLWCSFNVSSLKFKRSSKSYDNCTSILPWTSLAIPTTKRWKCSINCKNLTQFYLIPTICINKIKFNIISLWFLQLSHKQVQFH
jgi:hypothetical protein